MSQRPDLAGDSSLAGIVALLGFVPVATAQVANMILARGLAGAGPPLGAGRDHRDRDAQAFAGNRDPVRSGRCLTITTSSRVEPKCNVASSRTHVALRESACV